MYVILYTIYFSTSVVSDTSITAEKTAEARQHASEVIETCNNV